MSEFTPGIKMNRFVRRTVSNRKHTRDSFPASPQGEDSSMPLSQLQNEDFQNWQLSGLFTVPTIDLPLTMFLYVSSQLDTEETVQIQVNMVVESGKNIIFQSAVGVPAQGAVQFQFDVGALGLMGKTVEVLLRSAELLNIFQLFPSVNIVEEFPADGATLPLLFVPPASFQQVFPIVNNTSTIQPEASPQEEPLPPILLTTGVVEIPQGVFAIRPQVELVLSSFFDETLTADVVINKLVRGTTTKEQVLAETLIVPPMEARQLVINSVEGLPIEINLSLSRTEQGNSLQPAINVANVFMVTESVNLVLFIPPGKLMGILTDNAAGRQHANAGLRRIKQGHSKGGL